MRKGHYRLVHQVASDEQGRPRILYNVVRRSCGTHIAGPYDDWRMAQKTADSLDGAEAPSPSQAPTSVETATTPPGALPRSAAGGG